MGNKFVRDDMVELSVVLPKFLVKGSGMVDRTSLLVEELELTTTYNGPVQIVIILTLQ